LSASVNLAKNELRDAKRMELMWAAESVAALALIGSLMPDVEAAELERGRKKRRGPKDRPKLETALGAIVGDLLRNFPSASYCSLHRDYFVGQRVAYDQFDSALKALIALGYVHRHPTLRFPKGFGYKGEAARLMPATMLLTHAAAHGVTPDAISAAFRVVPNEGKPKPPPEVVEMWTVRGLDPSKSPTARTKVAIDPANVAGRIRRELIEKANAAAARHHVTGCLAPVWKVTHASSSTTFNGDWSLGGRWYAAGWGGAYWRLNERVRAGIRIDGEGTVEIDVVASQLSLLLGRVGLTLPQHPYDFPRFPRPVVKQFIIQTLGNGRPLRKWRDDVPGEIRQHVLKDVEKAVLARYPILAEPSIVLPERYVGLPLRRKVLTHWLMGLESSALSFAIQAIWKDYPEALVLPVFDSLIVPASLEETARKALGLGYRAAGNGVTVGLKRKAPLGRGDTGPDLTEA
jgi:hypothetical protein